MLLLPLREAECRLCRVEIRWSEAAEASVPQSKWWYWLGLAICGCWMVAFVEGLDGGDAASGWPAGGMVEIDREGRAEGMGTERGARVIEGPSECSSPMGSGPMRKEWAAKLRVRIWNMNVVRMVPSLIGSCPVRF